MPDSDPTDRPGMEAAVEFLIPVVAVVVAVVLARIINNSKAGSKAGSRSGDLIGGRLRAAIERATSVPPPMTTGQYVAPQHPNQPPPGWQPPPPPGWQPPPVAWQPPPPGRQQPAMAPAPGRRTRKPLADLNAEVRELMAANREVAAVRLLCDEADLGIIEAQQYARELVGRGGSDPAAGPAPSPLSDESGYVGSAAFATSIFDTGEDQEWASGWVDRPEPEDRSDIDELWRTVRDSGNPANASSAGHQPGNRP
jgi:hypothetical protein